jgi:hypothetical protein
LYGYVNGNPLNYIDPLGLVRLNFQQCDDGCKQTYLDCLAQCIRTYDPLNNLSAIGLTAIGGTFPKSWVGLPRGLAGASSFTTAPSVMAYYSGGGGVGTLGGLVRGLGRLASPVWIGYGLYLSSMEGYCLISCANDKCAY